MTPRLLAPCALLLACCALVGPNETTNNLEPPQSCSAWDLVATQAFETAWNESEQKCITDADCVLDDRNLTCSSTTSFGFCPVARRKTDEAAEAFADAVAASRRAACRPETPECVSTSSCATAQARCTSGRCTVVMP